MALDLIFRNVNDLLARPTATTSIYASLGAADVSEAQLVPASVFLETTYGIQCYGDGILSRAQTPGLVRNNLFLPEEMGSKARVHCVNGRLCEVT